MRRNQIWDRFNKSCLRSKTISFVPWWLKLKNKRGWLSFFFEQQQQTITAVCTAQIIIHWARQRMQICQIETTPGEVWGGCVAIHG